MGLVTGACFAEKGHTVICMDNDKKKIELLQKGVSPIYEPGLETLITKNIEKGNLRFTTHLDDAVHSSQAIFIAVGTPSNADGSVNLNAVYGVASEIAKSMNGYKIIVNKSTVPVGTADEVKKVISAHTQQEYDVVSNPEFLREGKAIEDFMNPDRIVVGVENTQAEEMMKDVYASFITPANALHITDTKSAEIIKYASNLFLATKISFISEIAGLCEKVGANIDEVSKAVGADKRIGKEFLAAGLGYGGSCLPKDVKGLISTAKKLGLEMKIAQAVEEVNTKQKTAQVSQLKNYFDGFLVGRRIAIWGLSFKPGTDDVREAPAVNIINKLLEEGVGVKIYDPQAMENGKNIFGYRVYFADSPYDALTNCDALLIATEWDEFKSPDFDEIKKRLKKPVVFDGRNIYDPKKMKEMGFEYRCIGK